MEYSCRICRTILIENEQLLNEKHQSVDGRGCTSYFTKEPPSWFINEDSNITEGKLLCFHCQAKIGYYNWSGTKCSCGIWVTPAFQYVCSRLDIKKRTLNMNIGKDNIEERIINDNIDIKDSNEIETNNIINIE